MPTRDAKFFGEPRRRFGVIHHAATRDVPLAVVVVPPFGYEEICAHRSLRALADALAAAGVPAVRVDLDGTGDSEGSDLEPDRLAAWQASIADAIALAHGELGVARVIVLGLRLGATLAVLAAEGRADVDAVIAIAPVIKPKAYLRELAALQGALGLVAPPAGAVADVSPAEEATGFAITTATRTALAALDLTTATPRRALAIDRDDLKASDAYVTAWRGRGAEVEHERLPGYVDLMADPHLVKEPTAMIARVVAYARARAAAPAAVPATPPAILRGVTRARIAGADDEIVPIDDAMVACVTRPPAGAPRTDRTLLLLNAGAVGRIGPNRSYVELARRLATLGVTVARVDQSGVGDSDTRRGEAEHVVYGERALADAHIAAGWAARTLGGTLAVAGLCSGAFHALRLALDGEYVQIAIPINCPLYRYQPGQPLDFSGFRATREAQRYKQAIGDGGKWKKLLRGEVDVRAAARVVVQRTRDQAEAWVKDRARALRVPLAHDFPTQLRQFAERGGRARFVFAEDDPGRPLLHEEGGETLERLIERRAAQVVTIAGADHTFTARWTQPMLLEAVERAVLDR